MIFFLLKYVHHEALIRSFGLQNWIHFVIYLIVEVLSIFFFYVKSSVLCMDCEGMSTKKQLRIRWFINTTKHHTFHNHSIINNNDNNDPVMGSLGGNRTICTPPRWCLPVKARVRMIYYSWECRFHTSKFKASPLLQRCRPWLHMRC